MFSIIIPSLNNLEYLKLCLKSLQKNSKYNHDIIVHSNIGSDGTLEYLKEKNIKYTHSNYNSGICKAVNTGAKKASTEFIIYAHDDFYFLPGWDDSYLAEIKKQPNNLYYLSGTMVQNGQVRLDCGDNIKNFNEQKLLSDYDKIAYYDFQGSTWAPHLIHKELWNKVGGFSEEFFPGTGSDPDLNMKLWNEGVRIFKGLSSCKVYHFGSIVTRKYQDKNVKTESGSKGAKIFLLKWGFKIKFFNKHYLRGCVSRNGLIICKKFDGPLQEPIRNFLYFYELFLSKLSYFYNKLFINSYEFRK